MRLSDWPVNASVRGVVRWWLFTGSGQHLPECPVVLVVVVVVKSDSLVPQQQLLPLCPYLSKEVESQPEKTDE